MNRQTLELFQAIVENMDAENYLTDDEVKVMQHVYDRVDHALVDNENAGPTIRSTPSRPVQWEFKIWKESNLSAITDLEAHLTQIETEGWRVISLAWSSIDQGYLIVGNRLAKPSLDQIAALYIRNS